MQSSDSPRSSEEAPASALGFKEFVTLMATAGGALIGFYVGQQFDGTTLPLAMGYIACGVIALLIVLITEGGRLFQPVHSPS